MPLSCLLKPYSSIAMAIVFALLATVDQAAAVERRVRIINETSFDLIEFYGSNVGTDSWEEDLLGNDVLPAGRFFDVNFDDGSGYCIFDFLGVFEDGDEVVKRRVNVCQIGTFRFAE